MKILAGLVLCVACALGSEGAHAQVVTPPFVGPAFSAVTRAGDTLYVSGTLGIDRAVGKPPSDAAVEAAHMLDSVKALLAKEGVTMDDLVTVTVFCSDLNLYATFNKVYVGYFTKTYPSRAFIGAKELLSGAHFEIMGVAQVGAGAKKDALK